MFCMGHFHFPIFRVEHECSKQYGQLSTASRPAPRTVSIKTSAEKEGVCGFAESVKQAIVGNAVVRMVQRYLSASCSPPLVRDESQMASRSPGQDCVLGIGTL